MFTSNHKVRIVATAPKPHSGGVYVAETNLMRALKGHMKSDALVVAEGRLNALRFSLREKVIWIPRSEKFNFSLSRKSNLTHYLGLKYKPNLNGKFILTIHDICSIYFEDEEPLPDWFIEALFSASRLIVPSEFTKREILKTFDVPPEKIRVVQNGPGLIEEEGFHSFDAKSVYSEQFSSNDPFLIRIGGYTKRKNVEWLLDVWPRLVSDFPFLKLILVGPSEHQSFEISDLLTKLPNVVNLGQVSDSILLHLLKEARALIFPSIYEGFGLPLVEAMRLGTPVIAKRTEIAYEICQEAALYVEDAVDVSKCMSYLMNDTHYRSNLIACGSKRSSHFSWIKTARLLSDIYEEVLQE